MKVISSKKVEELSVNKALTSIDSNSKKNRIFSQMGGDLTLGR